MNSISPNLNLMIKSCEKVSKVTKKTETKKEASK